MFKFIAHVCIALIFISAGYFKFQDISATAKQISASPLPKMINKLDLPFDLHEPEIKMLAQAVAGIELGCGVLIVIGIFRKLAAAVLIVALIVITVFIHLNLEDPAKTPLMDMIAIQKNIAIIGGLLLIVAERTKLLPSHTKDTKPVSSSKKNA